LNKMYNLMCDELLMLVRVEKIMATKQTLPCRHF